MADFEISVGIDARDAKTGAGQAKREIRSLADETERTGRRVKSSADSGFAALGKQLKQLGPQIQQIGQSLQSAGVSLTGAFTAPLAALATLGVRSALELDAVRTKITALVGDSEKANAKIAELRNLANNSVGVTQKSALETFAQLKGLGDIADESINKIITSMGKLNAAFKIDDMDGFVRNLNQIFSQGFERADIKEAIGRVPFFEQLLEQAFGTKDADKLRQMKDAGKLTMDTFLSGLSDAINGDPRIANVGENLSTKISKSFERLNVALAPVGEVILNAVVPIIEKAAPLLEKLGQWFASLSPSIQTAIVAFGGFVAAIGPALVIIGTLVTSIGSIISAAGAIAGAIAAIGGLGPAIAAVVAIVIGLGVQLAALGAAIYVLYQAWETNFGGIRDLTATVASAVQAAWASMMTAIDELTQQILAEINVFWAENGEQIKQIVNDLSESLRATWQAIAAFWAENGETIKAMTSAVWEFIKSVIVGAVQVIANTIKLILAVIRGDWSAAWEALKGIVTAVINAIIAYLNGVGHLFVGAIKLALQAIWDLHTWVYPKAMDLGAWIVKGLIAGIGSMAGPLGMAAAGVVNGAIDRMRAAAKVQSPSKVTHELGHFIAEGLADGMTAGQAIVGEAAESLTQRTFAGLDPRAFENVLGNIFDTMTNRTMSFGQKLRSIFGNIFDNFKQMLSGMLQQWIQSKLFGGSGGMGGMAIGGGFGGMLSGGGGGGGLGGLLGGIFGGGSSSSGAASSGGSVFDTYNKIGTNRGGTGAAGGAGSIGGGRQLFGGGLSTGIGIASVAGNMIGGMVGGRWGNMISLASTGLGIGWMVGGPVGAAIGAGIGALGGFLMSIFGGDPKRKRDKKEKMPQLNKGFTDSLAELRNLVQDVRTLRVSPDSALGRAQELRNQIASGFGIQFESKKYRKQAQQLIQQRTREADGLIEELRKASEIANAAMERDRRLIPEFASGIFMSSGFARQYADFKRRNGMLPGAWTGRDTVPAMLAQNEMVLNPRQQAAVRTNAGMDPFTGAGIPGYAGGYGGGSQEAAPAAAQPMNLNLVFEHSIDAEGMVRTAVKNSDSVQREISVTIEDRFANDQIKLRRRGN